MPRQVACCHDIDTSSLLSDRTLVRSIGLAITSKGRIMVCPDAALVMIWSKDSGLFHQNHQIFTGTPEQLRIGNIKHILVIGIA